MIRHLAMLVLAYCSMFAMVAVSLQQLSGLPSTHMPIATIASVVWILIWFKSEKAMDSKSVLVVFVIYVVLFIAQYVLSRLRITVIGMMGVSSENFWLASFEAIAIPVTILSVFRRISHSKKFYPPILKYIFYVGFILGSFFIIAAFLRSVIFPPEFV